MSIYKYLGEYVKIHYGFEVYCTYSIYTKVRGSLLLMNAKTKPGVVRWLLGPHHITQLCYLDNVNINLVFHRSVNFIHYFEVDYFITSLWMWLGITVTSLL